ncbi:hypothetical protein ABNC85_19755, partial [Paenibacillus larvae]
LENLALQKGINVMKRQVTFKAVANMPGAVPRTSTIALTNVTLSYAREIANKGYSKACLENLALQKGINVMKRQVTFKAVADAIGYDYKEPLSLLD